MFLHWIIFGIFHFLRNFWFVSALLKLWKVSQFNSLKHKSHKLTPDVVIFHRRDFGCKSSMSCGEAWDWRKSISIIHRRSTSWRRTRFSWKTSDRGKNSRKPTELSLIARFTAPQEVQSPQSDGERRHSTQGEERRARGDSRVHQIAAAAAESKSNLFFLSPNYSGCLLAD